MNSSDFNYLIPFAILQRNKETLEELASSTLNIPTPPPLITDINLWEEIIANNIDTLHNPLFKSTAPEQLRRIRLQYIESLEKLMLESNQKAKKLCASENFSILLKNLQQAEDLAKAREERKARSIITEIEYTAVLEALAQGGDKFIAQIKLDENNPAGTNIYITYQPIDIKLSITPSYIEITKQPNSLEEKQDQLLTHLSDTTRALEETTKITIENKTTFISRIDKKASAEAKQANYEALLSSVHAIAKLNNGKITANVLPDDPSLFAQTFLEFARNKALEGSEPRLQLEFGAHIPAQLSKKLVSTMAETLIEKYHQASTEEKTAIANEMLCIKEILINEAERNIFSEQVKDMIIHAQPRTSSTAPAITPTAPLPDETNTIVKLWEAASPTEEENPESEFKKATQTIIPTAPPPDEADPIVHAWEETAEATEFAEDPQ